MSDADRKRLSSLFREALGEGDVLATPDVLLHDSHVPVAHPPYQGSGATGAATSGATSGATSAATSATSPLLWILVGVVLLLVGAVGYLLWSGDRPGALHGENAHAVHGPGVASVPPAVSLEEDDEVAHLTGHDEPVDAGGLQMQRTQRGMPQMPQMRPTNFQAPPKKKAPRRPVEEEEEGDDDPLFQALEE